ncbi:hypothetical protein DOY81_007038 [Sarcophaga bullata]|nr:hypothetical protein DOY81_007038 [Sarcophaga bullata]
MEFNTSINLERLEEQLFVYKPSLKSSKYREHVSEKLRSQLIESKPVVSIQPMDTECENLMKSLKQRLMLLQDILVPKHQLQNATRRGKNITELNLSSDSSDDETLSKIMAKRNNLEKHIGKGKVKSTGPNYTDSRKPRERRLSYKSYSSSSTSNLRNYNTKCNSRQEHTVSTSGVVLHHNDDLPLEDINSTPTLHIKIPSLHRGNIHYIVLDSLKFARRVFDYRAKEVKQQSLISETKIKKSNQTQVKTSIFQQLSQQGEDSELSQLIQDVMAEACKDETLEATKALENINNNLIANYDSNTNGSILSFSQSSQEFLLSQNSRSNSEISSDKNDNVVKKSRKYMKRSNGQKPNYPPKKRGRKPKKNKVSCEDSCPLQAQLPTKSNLAKYVEYFANDCDQLMPGSSTPAASSTMSQPLVSSTTHNFEVTNQQQQHQPITYYIDGDWINGGLCQLVPSNGMSVDVRQLNAEDINVPFQDFVNYIDNNSDTGNNAIARVLDNGNALPISVPLPIANVGIQNLIQNQTNKNSEQSMQYSSVPIINIQIPSIPNNIGPSLPPPAHSNAEVLDLTLKSKNSVNIVSSEIVNTTKTSNGNTGNYIPNAEENCLPLDLSIKSSENNCVPGVADNQDDDFIRRLIETSDFDYSSEDLKKGCNSTISSYDTGKSFKAALDMPLLDIDETDLDQLVKHSTTSNNHNSNERSNLTADNCTCDNITNINNSNYGSMAEEGLSIENTLHFSDHSTKEIFDQLLDIGPVNTLIHNKRDSKYKDLSESEFYHSDIQNSMMTDIENTEINMPQIPEDTSNEIENNEVDIGTTKAHLEQNNIVDECKDYETAPSSPFSKEINICEKAEDLNVSKSSEMSLNLKFSDAEESIGLNSPEFERKIKSRNDLNAKSTNTDKLNINKNKFSQSNDMEVEKTKKSTKNENKTAHFNETEVQNEKPIVENSCAESNSKLNVKENNSNIVFSVAKITLSEDDNIYTDSDTASGISCDSIGINKNASMETCTNNFDSNFTNNVNNTKIDNYPCHLNNQNDAIGNQVKNLNIYAEDSFCSCNEVLSNKDTNFENSLVNLTKNKCENETINTNIPQQLYCQSNDIKNKSKSLNSSKNIVSNNIETVKIKTNAVIPLNSEQEKKSNEIEAFGAKKTSPCRLVSSKHFTLLDLESKLEDPLDFEEDLDDALSLTTSCFDSSDDDRFLDSVADNAMLKQTPEETTLEKSVTEALLENSVKPFKIPKIQNPNPIDAKTNEPTLGNTIVSKTTFTNMGKITRTVTNTAAQHPPSTNIQISSNEMVVKSENEINQHECLTSCPENTYTNSNALKNLFGVTCLLYLVDECTDSTSCKLSHKLNDPRIVFQRLSNLSKENINISYQIHYNNIKLFHKYFKTFCAYYTTKNDRIKLLNMINDCERYPEYAQFIIDIYEGLLKIGLSRPNACRLILKRSRNTSAPILDALVAIILQSDWTMFTDYIEKYTQETYKYNFRLRVLEQMAPAVLNSTGPHLRQIFGKCVQILHCEDTGLLPNSPLLIQCIALLTQT